VGNNNLKNKIKSAILWLRNSERPVNNDVGIKISYTGTLPKLGQAL
jgi:hypothetical protein